MILLIIGKGEGVKKDYQKAIIWFGKAAERGHPAAQYNLGLMFHNAMGIPLNYDEARRWFVMSAEGGLAEAQYQLGRIYYDAIGVQQGFVKAHMWFEIAAFYGHDDGHTSRDEAALKRMTRPQIIKAQNLAQQWINKRETKGSSN